MQHSARVEERLLFPSESLRGTHAAVSRGVLESGARMTQQETLATVLIEDTLGIR
jgi:hypothetical protein